MKYRKVLLVGLVLLPFSCGTGCGRGRPEEARTERLLVYVPCALFSPVKSVTKVFERENRTVKVRLIVGSATALTDKVAKGGQRPDVFLSPGWKEIGQLEAQNLLDESARGRFARFSLALITPELNPRGIHSWQDLAANRVRTLSISDPEVTTIGYSSRQALQHAGVWEAVQGKLLKEGGRIGLRDSLQSLLLVRNGKVDAGFGYISCPVEAGPEGAPGRPVKIIEPAPDDWYDPVYCEIALLKESQNLEPGRKYVDFVLSERTQKRLRKLGLPSPDEQKTE
jgi:molybdate transport system substrate-binding protein